MGKIGGLGAIAAVAMTCAGCLNFDRHEVDVSATDRIQIGRSTKQDVTNLLGPPKTRMQPLGQNERWWYSNSSSNYGTAKFLAQAYTFGAYQPDMKFGSESVVITFSGDVVADCVISVTESERTSAGPWGAGGRSQGTNMSQRKCGEAAGR
jgi:outer membrane protein assembly factor BamE (lipoprotein component of BamABCDE complex)